MAAVAGLVLSFGGCGDKVLEIREGRQDHMGAIDVCVGGIAPRRADIATAPSEWAHKDDEYGHSFWVEEGYVIPIGGSLHRLVKVDDAKEIVQISESPVTFPDVTLASDRLVCLLGGQLILSQVELHVESIAVKDGKAEAQIFTLPWAITVDKGEKTGALRRQTVTIGSEIDMAGRRLKVINIVPKDRTRKLPGWVELSEE